MGEDRWVGRLIGVCFKKSGAGMAGGALDTLDGTPGCFYRLEPGSFIENIKIINIPASAPPFTRHTKSNIKIESDTGD
jgi:hypothetical protein